MKTLPASKLNVLERRARRAAALAYAPYSGFAVGAAVLTDAGKVFSAANVENASYGLSMCAERNAVQQAVSRGARRIAAVVVYTPTAEATPPCGACRQVLAEFGGDAFVVCLGASGKARRYRLAELLPNTFSKANLDTTRGGRATVTPAALHRQSRRRKP